MADAFGKNGLFINAVNTYALDQTFENIDPCVYEWFYQINFQKLIINILGS